MLKEVFSLLFDENVELSMLDAEKYISAFFENNPELINAFVAIYEDMLNCDSDFIIRVDNAITGVGKRGETCRFYISKQGDEYFIKYNNRKEDEIFVPSNLELYFTYNRLCNDFFAASDVSLLGNKKTKSPRGSCDASCHCVASTTRLSKDVLSEWTCIRTKAENALKFTNNSMCTEYSDIFYDQIVELVVDACSNREFMTERDGDVIINRILNSPPKTLADLGKKYNVSRECIRQREKKSWRRLTFGIYRYKGEKYICYRERLKCILLSIPDETFINTISQISLRNTSIGLWLQKIVVGNNDKSEVALAMNKLASSIERQSKLATGASSIAVNKIKNTVDIVEYISSYQKVSLKGEIYRADCPFCNSSGSFVVYPKTKTFYCFSCNVGGDVITYLMKAKGLDYKSATSELISLWKAKMQLQEQEDIFELMREAALYYHSQLKNNAKARGAIDVLHFWGIRGKTIVQLGIGFHDDSFYSLIDYMTRQKSYSMTCLEKAGLVLMSSRGGCYDKMRNSIIIPTINASGKVVCFDFYIIEKKQLLRQQNTRYFKRSQNLYSYNLAIKSNKKSVIVVTTYEDYFKLVGLGFMNTVSTYLPQVTKEQLELLRKKFKVIITFEVQGVNNIDCFKFCSENNMYCDRINTRGCSSVGEYIEKNSKMIADKISEYENILT